MDLQFQNNSEIHRHLAIPRRLVYLLFCSPLATLLLLYALRPIRDPDFWWHLKTGDLIVQQRGLLQFDPFNYTGDGIVHGFQAVLLYGYWLWEICASLLFTGFGFAGIFLLKMLTALLLSCVVFMEMRRRKLSMFTMMSLAPLGALVVINVYHLERPQIFSFLFATLLIGMISRTKEAISPTPLLFPLMTLWANVHRGFVIGDIILALAAAGFMIQYLNDRKSQLRLAAWAMLGVLASFVNPNGWGMIIELSNFIQNSIGPAHVVEYRDTWQLFLLQSRCAAICLWTLSALHIAGLFLTARRNWPEILVSLFMIVSGLAYIRNTGFIAIALLPLTGWYLEQAWARWRLEYLLILRTVACVLLALTVSWYAAAEWQAKTSARSPVSNEFPVNMAEFLKDSGLSGRLFNDYNAGGYLDWALYPECRTFIDGRELDTRVSHQYLRIAGGSMEPLDGRPYCLEMLDRYRIDIVALRIALLDGRLQPLLKLLLPAPQWIPVFLDDQSFVLARNTPANASVIRRCGIDKGYFLDMLTLMIGNYVHRAPQSAHLSVMYADLLNYRGRRREGRAVLQQLETAGLSPEMQAYLRNQ